MSREAVPLPRACGVLLHPTSLPGGGLGPEAYGFVDWLVEAGQSFWQVLPLGPPDAFGSPYAGLSAFAGWGGLLADPDARVGARALAAFRRRHAYWLDDWLDRSGSADEAAAQVRFEREWEALRSYANERGVRIIGDLPLYVDRESADVAAHPAYFDLSLLAGVPPDLFSRSGQLWGSPTYRWGALRRDGYRWWIERFRRSLQLFDLTRLDHFRGFVAYWAVRAGNRTARRGRWLRGPGKALFDAVSAELGPLPVIGEDLGHITPPVHRLREELGVPGMHILQWAFGGGRGHPDTLANHREYAVVYTGTHDNDPCAGWWEWAPRRVRSRVEEAGVEAGIEEDDPSWVLIELALSSRSRLAIVQLQDVLGLGSEARMNRPSTIGGNWSWRLRKGELTAEHAARLRAATSRWGRLTRRGRAPSRRRRSPRR
jgi:4-alpha-glucanotransferase